MKRYGPVPTGLAEKAPWLLQDRLTALGATGESWTSWKDSGGNWMVKLTFASGDIDHDARWSFEPKKAALAPVNGEAVTLSQQGDISGAFVPRLRAVGNDSRAADSSRFDSGAFSDEELRHSGREPATEHVHDEPDDGPAFAPGAIHRATRGGTARGGRHGGVLGGGNFA